MHSLTHDCMTQSDFNGILVHENSSSLIYNLWTSNYTKLMNDFKNLYHYEIS